jgi:hypothetical protein
MQKTTSLKESYLPLASHPGWLNVLIHSRSSRYIFRAEKLDSRTAQGSTLLA